MRKISHTDVVVEGRGFNVSVYEADGRWYMNLRPDTPSKEAERVAMKFWEAVGEDSWRSQAEGKREISRAIKEEKAKWNGWHKETYD